MNELALFAGAGGGILGGHLLGWRCVCAVEYDKYARNVLLARQQDGCLPKFPIWDDVRTFDGKPWRGVVDVVSGGFPCQDISPAGKGVGIEGSRSGLWKEMARIIGEVRPRYAFVENSPLLIRRGLTTVLSDLSEMGYDAVWGIVSAADCGAPHIRKRIWILAYAKGQRCGETWTDCKRQEKRIASSGVVSRTYRATETRFASIWENVFNSLCTRLERQRQESSGTSPQQRDTSNSSWWKTEPNVGRVDNGVAARVDRLRCIGNGQVPIVAATAWRRLFELVSSS